MSAVLLYDQQFQLNEDEFVEIVIWQLDAPVPGSKHVYKYRMAFMHKDECVMRMDNERGKGDHLHRGSRQYPYVFKSILDLDTDFWTEVWKWQEKNARS
ncbi:MAG: hypothetical protein HC855_15070 [Rhizobiales bacterium]|nr:hypothetical protein [Hyphomicrobiales bacterium]